MYIKIHPLTSPKPKYTDESKLGFGKLFTDRMFVMEYSVDLGWHSARIEPYGPFALDPALSSPG